jgi:hypothetical protein
MTILPLKLRQTLYPTEEAVSIGLGWSDSHHLGRGLPCLKEGEREHSLLLSRLDSHACRQ